MSIARRSRWALSFADLTLLLLGFFVLMHATEEERRDRALGGITRYFGSVGATAEAIRADIPARDVFVAGEAIVTDAGRARLATIATSARESGRPVRISSRGLDGGTARFDGWDLASARVGAVARALTRAGVPASAIRITGPDSGDETRDAQRAKGQVIMVRAQ